MESDGSDKTGSPHPHLPHLPDFPRETKLQGQNHSYFSTTTKTSHNYSIMQDV